MTRRRCLARRAFTAVALAIGLLIGLVLAGPAPAAASVHIPPDQTENSPPGTNDLGCVLSPEHPRPLVLVHGTFSRAAAFNLWTPRLVAEGFCVFALNYGRDPGSLIDHHPAIFGTGDIRVSAAQLAAFVDRVLASTGAAKVDLVGHSQGGLVVRRYLRFNGGADRVHPARNLVASVITLGTPNRGTTLDGLGALAAQASPRWPALYPGLESLIGKAGTQQLIGSDFLRELNAAGDTDPGVAYTAIATREDLVSTPPQLTFLAPGPGATVKNVWVRDGHPASTVDHARLREDPWVLGLVLGALDSGHVAVPPVD